MRHICTSIVATLMLAGATFADIINVPADYATIQAAVDAAVDGDEVVVAPGTYTGTGDEVVNMLGKAITLRASGTPEETIIDGEDARRCVFFSPIPFGETKLVGFTVTRGYANPHGAGIYCDIQTTGVTISQCRIVENSAHTDGGGIYCLPDSACSITDCVIIDNNAGLGMGGGIYAYGGSYSINGCTITGNSSGADAPNDGSNIGGGVCIWSSSYPFFIGNCSFSENTAGRGGGVFVGYTAGTIENCNFANNNAAYTGGGLELYGDNKVVVIEDCSFTANAASSDNLSEGGGAIRCRSTFPTMLDCVFSSNQAIDGGAINLSITTANITGCDFQANLCSMRGGAIFTEMSTSYIGATTFSGNTATGSGGALFSASGSVDYVSDSIICENSQPQLIGNWVDGGGNLITDVCGLGACCTGNQSGCVASTQADCEYFGGTFMGYGVQCADVSCPTTCLGDVNSDGEVSVNDILTVIANWGPCP